MFTNKNTKHLMGGAVVVSTLLSLLSVVLQTLNFSAIKQIATNPATVAVFETGQTAPVVALRRGERTPESIRMYTTAVFYGIFNWTNVEPTKLILNQGNAEEKEKVIVVDGQEITIPVSVWQSSFAISDSFRIDFLNNIAQIMPKKVLKGQMRSLLIVDEISEPKEIEAGKWQVIVRAGLNFFDGNSLIQVIPIDRVVYLEAIEVPALPKSEDELTQAVYTMRFSGLQIYSIEEISSAQSSVK